MIRKNILFLTGNIFPCHAGDSIFAAGIVENLAANYNVDILSFIRSNFSENDEDYLRLKAMCNNINFVEFHQKSKVENYIEWLSYGHSVRYINKRMIQEAIKLIKNNQYDFVIIDHLRMYALYKHIEKYINRAETKIILIEQNVEFTNMQENIQMEKNILKKIKGTIKEYRLKSYESNAIKNIDMLWTLTEDDLNKLLIISNFKKATKVILPSAHYDRVKTEQSLYQPSFNLLFLGSMSWYPNVIGAKYFIDNIFNKILLIDERYKLYIVGNNPDQSLLKYASKNIIITGAVPSTDNYIEMCDFLVLPNKMGSGIKIKVLESILKGLPIISFKEGIIGYPEELFSNGFCPVTDDEFVQNILEINSKPQMKSDFIKRARALLERQRDIIIDLD